MSIYFPESRVTAEFKDLRERNGLSIPEAAKLLGVSEKSDRRWDAGQGIPKKAFIELLSLRLKDSQSSVSDDADFTFIDLFAGIGGMRRGFEAAGGKCVFTSEWDE